MRAPDENVYMITKIVRSLGYVDDLYTRLFSQEVHLGRQDGFEIGDTIRLGRPGLPQFVKVVK